MTMSESQYARAKEEIKELIESGVPVVGLSIFESIDNYTMSKVVRDNIDYFYELYDEYCQKVMSLPQDIRFRFLRCLKDCDIIDTNTMEAEDSFLLTLYRQSHKECSIDMLIQKFGSELTRQDFLSIHDKLLIGTSTENKVGIRTDNLQYVGSNCNGVRNVQYFPILCEEIDTAIEKFLRMYNSNLKSQPDKYDILIRSMIYHGLIAALQIFNDGNTRFGRNIQHVELWRMLRDYLSYNTVLPILYATREYSAYRTQYRACIRDIAILNNQEAWDKWFKFNLNRFEGTIYANSERFDKFQKRMNI